MADKTSTINGTEEKIKFEIEILKGFSLIFIAKTISQVVFFVVSNILLINWMSIISNNDYVIFLNYINLVFALILIVPLAMPKFLQKNGANIKIGYILNGIISILFNFIILIIVFLILMVGFNYNYNISISSSEFFWLFIMGALLYEFYRFFESILYGLKSSTKVAIINISLSIFFFIFALILVATLNLDLVGAIACYIISYLIVDIFSIFLTFAELKRNSDVNDETIINKPFNKEIQKELIIFCLPLFIGNFFYLLNTRFNTLLLSNLADGSALIYDLAVTLTIYLIGLLGLTINDLIFPHESHAFYHDDREKIKQIYRLMFTFVVLLIIPLLLISIMLSDIILTFLYPGILNQYPQFLETFQLILIGGFFYSLNQFIAKFIVAKGQNQRVLIIQIIGGTINFLIVLLMVQNLGIYSAIYGFIISMAIMFFLYFLNLTKIVPLSIWEFKLIQLLGSIIAIIVEFFCLIFVFNFNTIIAGALCAISYFFLLFAFKILSVEDIKIVIFNLRRIFFKQK